MKVNKKLIERIAENARLELSESEIKEFTPQIKEILDLFSKIEKVNTKNIEPSFHPFILKNVFREDKIKEGLTQEEALKNTKNKKNGFFIGPKAI